MSYWIALRPRIFSWSFASSARNSSTPRFGIENGLWEKSIFFSSTFHSYIGKSTIQQNSKRSLALRPDVLRQGTGAALLALAPEDITEARLALALRPGIHAVAERAVAALRRRDCPHAARGIVGENVGENLEAGTAERFTDILHHDWVAQVRLVGAVFRQRLGIGNEREFRRHRFTFGKFLEHAADHRLNRVEHILLRDEAHFQIELIEFAGRAIGARVLVAEAGRDLEIAVE